MLKKYQLLLLLVSVIFFCGRFCSAQANRNQNVSFPKQETSCNCSGLTCNCCQNVEIATLKMHKNACLQYTLKVQPIKLDVKISLDNKTVAEFSVDPKNPPSYCIPITLPASVAMCVKLHDIKLVDSAALQACATFYVNFQTDQIFDYKLPCVKLSGSGIDMK